MNSHKLAAAKPKKKCCRSKPRCQRCPLVVHKVRKAELNGIRGKELEKIFKRAQGLTRFVERNQRCALILLHKSR